MTLKELRAKRAAAAANGREILGQLNALLALPSRDAAQDAQTVSFDAELTALEAEIPALDAKIAEAEKMEAREAASSAARSSARPSAPSASRRQVHSGSRLWRNSRSPSVRREPVRSILASRAFRMMSIVGSALRPRRRPLTKTPAAAAKAISSRQISANKFGKSHTTKTTFSACALPNRRSRMRSWFRVTKQRLGAPPASKLTGLRKSGSSQPRKSI